MKFAKYLLISLAVASVGVAYADMPTKQVTLPFKEFINSKTHSGLMFKYDMRGKPAKKIVCELHHVYKGYLEYKEKGVLTQSGVYGDGDSVSLTLTNIGQSIDEQYHADIKGIAKVSAVVSERNHRAVATCFYQPDTNA